MLSTTLGGMRDISPTKEYNSDNTTDLNLLMSAKLSSYLSDHYSLNSCEEGPIVEREWIGIMGFTPDHQPLIGELTNRPGEYILAGYSGHGMPIAFLSGKLISSMICGEYQGMIEEHPWIESVMKEVYRPSRYGL
jgi:glycine/D-amino acid oxidase-like deaminating enzyme